jgi:hypothetical protein
MFMGACVHFSEIWQPCNQAIVGGACNQPVPWCVVDKDSFCTDAAVALTKNGPIVWSSRACGAEDIADGENSQKYF